MTYSTLGINTATEAVVSPWVEQLKRYAVTVVKVKGPPALST